MMLVFCLTIYSDLPEDLLLLCTENVHFSSDKWILHSKGPCWNGVILRTSKCRDIQNVISKVKEKQSIPSNNIKERHHQDVVSKSYLLILPYKRKREEKTARNITKEVNSILPNKHKSTLVHSNTTVSDRWILYIEWA